MNRSLGKSRVVESPERILILDEFEGGHLRIRNKAISIPQAIETKRNDVARPHY